MTCKHGSTSIICKYCDAETIERHGDQSPSDKHAREIFEEHAFGQRFLRSIKRNPNPPQGTGALDYISQDCPYKSEFVKRDENGRYLDQTLDAMWWAWQESREQLTLIAPSAEQRGDKPLPPPGRTVDGRMFPRVWFVSRQHIKEKPTEANPTPVRVHVLADDQSTPIGVSHASSSVLIPADRIPRLIELVSKACRTAAVDNDERSYELWTAVRRELNDAIATHSATRRSDEEKSQERVR